ncbi:GTP diphosphokinase, partial [Avibacterium endocarditidis]
MVAVRGSHLLNPKDFVIEQWSESLGLSSELAEKLVLAWHYSQDKIQQHQNTVENPQMH